MVRLDMSSGVRKDKVKMKKVIVSKAASWVKEWLRSGSPKGPRWSSLALGIDDFQWGWDVWGIG